MDTLPLVTLRMLKPTVGIMSSLNAPVCARRQPVSRAGGHRPRTRRAHAGPSGTQRAAVAAKAAGERGGRQTARRAEATRTAMTFTSDVLPAAFSPMSDSSISSLKNKLRGSRGAR